MLVWTLFFSFLLSECVLSITTSNYWSRKNSWHSIFKWPYIWPASLVMPSWLCLAAVGSGADRQIWWLQHTVVICPTKQLADSYYVNAVWREEGFSCWVFMIIESNHIRAHGGNMGKQTAFEKAAHQASSTGVEPHLQVHRLTVFAAIKRFEIELSHPFKYNALAHITAP